MNFYYTRIKREFEEIFIEYDEEKPVLLRNEGVALRQLPGSVFYNAWLSNAITNGRFRKKYAHDNVLKNNWSVMRNEDDASLGLNFIGGQIDSPWETRFKRKSSINWWQVFNCRFNNEAWSTTLICSLPLFRTSLYANFFRDINPSTVRRLRCL